jgi:hypothetical protein
MALKKNSKKILDIIASQPGINQTDAYRQVHPNTSDITARTNAYKLMKKPEAQIYLQKHVDKAKNKVVELISSDNEHISLKASESVLDRVLGKPTQKTESVSLNIEALLE